MKHPWRYYPGKALSNAVDFLTRPGRPFDHEWFPFGWRHSVDIRRFLKEDVELVVDCGANIGNTVKEFRLHFPGARIDALEPVNANYEKLEKRFSGDTLVRPMPLGCGDSVGEVEIFLSNDPECHSINSSDESNGSEMISITTLDEIYWEAEHRIDILKIDVEGLELKVLNGARKLLDARRIRAVFAEAGFQKECHDKTEFSRLHDFLVERRFYFAGLYQPFRWGNKREVYYGNALWLLRD